MSGKVIRYDGAKGDLLWTVQDCYDCSGCVAICPFDAMSILEGTVTAHMDKCTLCTLCARVCPTAAIAIERHRTPGGTARPAGSSA